jgi:uncharacterized protein (TIGR02145 family)
MRNTLIVCAVLFLFSAAAMMLPSNAGAFSSNAVPQATPETPLTEDELSGLLDSLKEGLAELVGDEDKATAITEKWDARRDLTGKTKSQVIDLLYEDAKTVVTNSGLRYQISQVFSLYHRMPDSQFSAKTSFRDARDGQVYGIAKVGNLTWMKENMRYDMRDESVCYDDDDVNCEELGMLYTYAGAWKACPTGWRLPSDNDWMDLERALGMPQNQLMIDGYSTPRGNQSGMLKVGGNSGLDFKISGFAILGDGDPQFDGITDDRPRSYFWTSNWRDINGERNAVRRRIEAKNGSIFRFTNPVAGYAVSVRCVR